MPLIEKVAKAVKKTKNSYSYIVIYLILKIALFIIFKGVFSTKNLEI